MTTTSKTWFYSKPENNAYALAERVRTNLWDARIGNIWLDTVRAESPFLMAGLYDGCRIEMEWEPGSWLALRSEAPIEFLPDRLGFVLGFKPDIAYEDSANGWTVWEWHLDGGDKRWQAIQGIPTFRQPRRLKEPS
jgi:hypothetical protein